MERKRNGEELRRNGSGTLRKRYGTEVERCGTKKNKNPPVTHAAGGFSIVQAASAYLFRNAHSADTSAAASIATDTNEIQAASAAAGE